MSSAIDDIVYSDLSKRISVLPLPYEIREMIYEFLEPEITIEPQYPINIRQAFEPDWNPGYKKHPMHGINSAMDDDILSRYRNQNNAAQTKYLPEKTTFRIWDKRSRLMKMHMDTFFDANNGQNCFGVRHLEYVFDGYRADPENLLALLSRFPNLKTLKVELRYAAGKVNACAEETTDDYLELSLKLWFKGSENVRPAERVKWEVREFYVLEDDD